MAGTLRIVIRKKRLDGCGTWPNWYIRKGQQQQQQQQVANFPQCLIFILNLFSCYKQGSPPSSLSSCLSHAAFYVRSRFSARAPSPLSRARRTIDWFHFIGSWWWCHLFHIEIRMCCLHTKLGKRQKNECQCDLQWTLRGDCYNTIWHRCIASLSNIRSLFFPWMIEWPNFQCDFYSSKGRKRSWLAICWHLGYSIEHCGE